MLVNFWGIDKKLVSVNLALMQINLAPLNKKAIDLALKGQWTQAIAVNKQILQQDSANIDAQIRLGRAYIQTSDFAKAKKIFKQILDIDPINSIAQKNYKLATEKRSEKINTHVDGKMMILEPGLTMEIDVELSAKGVKAEDFSHGEELETKINKKDVTFLKVFPKKGPAPVAKITNEVVHYMNKAKESGAKVQVLFVKGNGKTVSLLLKTTVQVFPAQKQDVRPYIKKGSLDEPELEIGDQIEEAV